MGAAILTGYGLVPVATVRVEAERFVIEATDASALEMEESIYAFLIGDEIVRIGSSKGKLRGRFGAWQRDVSISLAGGRSSTPPSEAELWREALSGGAVGLIYARQGHTVETPIGPINAYMSEESHLIGRHRPRMNRSMHR